ATQSVGGENLNFGNNTDINTALAGKVAGVKLLGSPSSTFDNAAVLIRGPKGFGLGDGALFVLDGTVVADASGINMDNIEDVSVLKGAAATALYGIRAADGVIMLTSKKGRKGGGTSIEVKTGIAFEKIGLMPKYQNEYGGGYSSTTNAPAANFTTDGWYHFKYNPALHPASWASWDGQKILEYGADESWGPRIDGSQYRDANSWYTGTDAFGQLSTMQANPNNIRDFFQTGRTLSNSVALTSSGTGYNVRLSYQNQDRSLIQINSKRMLHQVGLSGTFELSKRISFTTDIQYAFDDRHGQPYEGYRNDGLNITQGFNQWFQRQLDIKSMRNNIYAPDGRVTSWNIGDPNKANSLNNTVALTTPQYWDNPWFVATTSFRNSQAQRLTANVGIVADVAKGLKWNAYVRRYSLNNIGDSRIANGGLQQSYFGINQTQNSEMNYETNLLYKTKVSDFSIDGMVGMNIRRNSNNYMAEGTVGGLSVPNYFYIRASLQTPTYSNTFSRTEVWSHYARGTVGYKNFLFLDATIRRDQSSTLPTSNNSYIYSSGSLSFVFSDLLKNSSVSNWLSFGKLRSSIAQVGSDIGFASTATALSAGVPLNGIPTVTVGNTNRDALIKPAIQTAYEVGTELKFLNNKIGLDVGYYYNKNEDQILNVSIPSATGFSSLQTNAGEIINKGVEVA
ncbi:MAG: TonB-dependent receptor, partial [Chitinophagaceae bacterium]|nr:TonB-dependent receptor [Chitinophagaceae bacterium]